jgi:hypothetical protein
MKYWRWIAIVVLLLLPLLLQEGIALAQAPEVTTNGATGVTSDSATLNGNLTSLGNASSVNVWFEYATDAFYMGNGSTYSDSTTPQSMSTAGPFNSSASGLSGNTTYHFRAVASEGNNTGNGSDTTFTTASPALGVTTEAATGVTSDSATLNGTLTGLGNASSVNVWFQYATDAFYMGNGSTYSNSTAPQSMSTAGPFNSSVGGLSASTTYHFRAVASEGNNTDNGSDTTFTTAAPALGVTSDAATDVTADSATLNGTLTGLGNASSVNVWFQYATAAFYVGNGSTYSNLSATQPMSTAGPFNSSVGGLSGNTTYHFRAVTSEGNNTAYGNDTTFTTAFSVNLQGWGWCTNYNQVVAIAFDGYTTMVERANAPNSYSMHTVGNLTLPAPYNETISLDMYGNRARLVFYLRQEATGKSVNLEGTWIVNAAGNETYIGMAGWVALPNPEGEALKTARTCFVVLRTPNVEVPLTEPGSFTQDLDSMLSRFVKLVDSVVNSLIGTGFAGILSSILSKIAVLLAHLRALGIPYIP